MGVGCCCSHGYALVNCYVEWEYLVTDVVTSGVTAILTVRSRDDVKTEELMQVLVRRRGLVEFRLGSRFLIQGRVDDQCPCLLLWRCGNRKVQTEDNVFVRTMNNGICILLSCFPRNTVQEIGDNTSICNHIISLSTRAPSSPTKCALPLLHASLRGPDDSSYSPSLSIGTKPPHSPHTPTTTQQPISSNSMRRENDSHSPLTSPPPHLMPQ